VAIGNCNRSLENRGRRRQERPEAETETGVDAKIAGQADRVWRQQLASDKEARVEGKAAMRQLALFCATLVLASLCCERARGQELRYKVCTAEELRRLVEQFCMRLGRESNVLSLSPYGSVGLEAGGGGGGSGEQSDLALVEILRASRRLASGRSGARSGRQEQPQLRPQPQSQHLFKRDHKSTSGRAAVVCDYLESCCQESCVISAEDLGPFCSTL